ncbi:CoA transferase [Motiliproteus coralliicola]|uniref:CoA transferase n=1 Tax=Motiliproteus coralliicola TaxID=2283196 RepID=A0A369WWF8_9GAMM|nr:CaiB/BaiF CoA-transferase family protein [Motiliproteus coralliicola]RDE24876.1 CoA transferase [Motiliproteus coralliicola]
MNAPLQGIRVLDMSRILAGPWAGQSLADLGAEVIKIERPGCGDDTRHWGPPYLKDADGNDTAEAAYYMAANRGKRSVTVDITTEAGQKIIRDLAARSDVLLENYKVGGLKKYGLDYDSLKAVNPKLVYCSITGFGQDGPYAHRAGYDFMIQGMGGLMSITGEPDEKPGGGPVKVGVAVTDLFTGLYATIAVQGALLERQRSGLGQHIDLALFDVQAAVLANQATNYLVGGKVPQRLGNAHPNIVPYQAFATRDGHIILAVGNDSQFRAFCELADQNWADDPLYATNRARVENREPLCAAIAELIATQTSQYWLDGLEARSVPCGPINRIDQLFEDPQLLARGMKQTLQHPDNDNLNLVNNPIRFSRTPVSTDQAPPKLGDATEQTLQELGYSDEQIAALRQQQCI